MSETRPCCRCGAPVLCGSSFKQCDKCYTERAVIDAAREWAAAEKALSAEAERMAAIPEARRPGNKLDWSAYAAAEKRDADAKSALRAAVAAMEKADASN